MADWLGQYLDALKARDLVDKGNVQLYEHATRMQDQKAELAKRLAAAAHGQAEPKTPAPAPSYFRVSSPAVRPESPSAGQMRQDLAKAQQERSDLTSKLDASAKELSALQASSRKDVKKIAQLQASDRQLTLKLRDRDEELRGKTKLIQDTQDENATLTMQLNLADENIKKLRKENKDLVDRWMAKKGKEADRMNEQSKFG